MFCLIIINNKYSECPFHNNNVKVHKRVGNCFYLWQINYLGDIWKQLNGTLYKWEFKEMLEGPFSHKAYTIQYTHTRTEYTVKYHNYSNTNTYYI